MVLLRFNKHLHLRLRRSTVLAGTSCELYLFRSLHSFITTFITLIPVCVINQSFCVYVTLHCAYVMLNSCILMTLIANMYELQFKTSLTNNKLINNNKFTEKSVNGVNGLTGS